MEQFIHQIKALIVLDAEGNRMYSKYYSSEYKDQFPKQQLLEKNIFSKTQKSNAVADRTFEYFSLTMVADIVQVDKHTVVFQFETDLFFYILGSLNENELVLAEVLSALIDALQIIFRSQLEKRTFLENFDLIVLACDEVIDDGIIIEVDANTIAQKVLAMEGGSGARGGSKGDEGDALAQVLKSAQDQAKEIVGSLFSF